MEMLIYQIESVYVEWIFENVATWPFPTIAILARGYVNSTGWSKPMLVPSSYRSPPADGLLKLDFLATAPNPGDKVEWTVTRIGTLVAMPVASWVTGVRVHSSTNSVDAKLTATVKTERITPDEGLPLPWPFPWLSPPPQT